MTETIDAFLGGRVRVSQPERGFRSGVDAVLLAAAVTARPGETILELGCGAGVASLCLSARVPGLELTGVEIQSDYAALARRNGVANGASLAVFEADVAALPSKLRQTTFDHVMTNPPYRLRSRGTVSGLDRQAALVEAIPLSVWIGAGLRRLRPGGRITVIQKAERLPDVLTAVETRAGSVEVRPVSPRTGRAAELVLVRARKGGRGAFRLLAPLVLHDGSRHLADADDYSTVARAILRDCAAIAWD